MTRQKFVFTREGVVYVKGIAETREFGNVLLEKEDIKTYENIKKSMRKQLKSRENCEKYHLNLIDDYMALWLTKGLLIQDIEKRGVRVWYDNGGNQRGYKKNESVEQLVKINGQMLKLLEALNLKIDDAAKGDEDETL